VDTSNSSDHQPIEAPSGLDLHPQPQKAVRISRRASMAIVSLIVLLLLAFAYGGYRRTLSNQAAARDAGLPRNVTPATQAGTEFMQATPAGTVPMTRSHADELRPPDASSSAATVACGSDPKTGQPYRFNPQTGQVCDGFPQERVVVRQPNAMRIQTVPTTPVHEETPEDRRLAAPTNGSRRQFRRPPASAILQHHRSGQATPYPLCALDQMTFLKSKP
jgi:hypothetical protein